MRCLFVELYQPYINIKENDMVISLTPLSSYQLDKNGIKYQKIEDFYDKIELIDQEEKYYSEQYKWFESFDKYLSIYFKQSKENNIKLATSYYFHFKVSIDAIIQRCKSVEKFINKIKPDKIIYLSKKYSIKDKYKITYPLLFKKEPSLYYKITPLLCRKHKIKFERIFINENSEKYSSNYLIGNILNNIYYKIINNKLITYFYYYFKIFCLLYLERKADVNILFLKRFGYNLIDVIKEALSNSNRIFYKEGKYIYNQNYIYSKKYKIYYFNKKENNISKNKIITDLIEKSDILKWINSYCGVDVSSIIIPGFYYFIGEYCPQFILLTNEYLNFYNKHNIDFILTPHAANVEEYAAIFAAKCSNKTKSICLQHGNDVFNARYLDFLEYYPYDIYLTTDKEMESHIKKRIDINKFKTKVFQYQIRLNKLKNVNNIIKRKDCDRKIILYVPTMYPWDCKIWDGNKLDDTWYYEWHKILLIYLSRKENYNIIWKGIPSANETCDPIPNLLNDNKIKNIKYASNPMVKWLKKADLIIIDYPSTTLYEAAWSGKPVLSLNFSSERIIRESAKLLFGNTLQNVNNFKEGLEKIECFLNGDLHNYIVKIPYEKNWNFKDLKEYMK